MKSIVRVHPIPVFPRFPLEFRFSVDSVYSVEILNFQVLAAVNAAKRSGPRCRLTARCRALAGDRNLSVQHGSCSQAARRLDDKFHPSGKECHGVDQPSSLTVRMSSTKALMTGNV